MRKRDSGMLKGQGKVHAEGEADYVAERRNGHKELGGSNIWRQVEGLKEGSRMGTSMNGMRGKAGRKEGWEEEKELD